MSNRQSFTPQVQDSDGQSDSKHFDAESRDYPLSNSHENQSEDDRESTGDGFDRFTDHQVHLSTSRTWNSSRRSLASGKAPGGDGIPPDLLKHSKTTLLHSLHILLCQCWQGAVPQDMRDSKIITLFKNKEERSDCNNYSGISLLSVIGKVFAKIILIRLHKLAECVYSE